MKKVALSISGGGAKGAYSAGVLYRLHMKGFFRAHTLSVISGTSTGSLIGTLLARNQFAELKTIYAGGVKTGNILEPAAGTGAIQLLRTASSILGIEVPEYDRLLEEHPDLLAIASVVDGKKSIYTISPLKDLIREFIGLSGFGEIIGNPDVELIFNVVSMNSGDVRGFSSRDNGRTATEMERALWASVSQPVFMPLVDIGQEWYADGGLSEVNPVQSIFTSKLPYDGIIAISCSPDPAKTSYTGPLDDLTGVLIRTIDVLLDDVTLNDVRVPQLFLALRTALDELKAADEAGYDRTVEGFSDELNGLLDSVNFSTLRRVPIAFINPGEQVLENGLAFNPEAMKAAFAEGEKTGEDVNRKLVEMFGNG